MGKKKLKLEDLSIKSFATSLQKFQSKTIKGEINPHLSISVISLLRLCPYPSDLCPIDPNDPFDTLDCCDTRPEKSTIMW